MVEQHGWNPVLISNKTETKLASCKTNGDWKHTSHFRLASFGNDNSFDVLSFGNLEEICEIRKESNVCSFDISLFVVMNEAAVSNYGVEYCDPEISQLKAGKVN